jgi:hypothetical protein
MRRHSGFLALLAGTLAVACSSSSTDAPDAPAAADEVTWHGQIAPLVTARCVGCHQDGGVAPFSLQRYEDAFAHAYGMAEQTRLGTMPPFLAQETEECVPRHGWKDDLRLTDAEKALFSRWHEANAPEGDPSRAAPLPEPVSLSLEAPDLTVAIGSPVVVDGNQDRFVCHVMDTGLTADTWIDAVQIVAGNQRVVHHVLVYDDVNLATPEDRVRAGKYECFGGTGVRGASLIHAWAPGGVPVYTPKGVARELKAGARLVMQVHYHPVGTSETDDSTRVEFRFAKEAPEYRTTTSLIGNLTIPTQAGTLLPGPNDPPGEIKFVIPAGVSDHTETIAAVVSAAGESLIWSMGTHMHYVGRDMAIHLRRGNPRPGEPKQECLIQTPSWDFNWQRGYRYDAELEELPVARQGDTYLMRCRYDNSLDNPFVREALREQGLSAPHDVHLGEATLDEMCLGAFGIATKIEP